MTQFSNRRLALKAFGAGIAATGIAAATAASAAPAAAGLALVPESAGTLQALGKTLAAAPRRRDFKTVPMILDNPDQWDSEALNAVLAYKGGPRQSWDNTELKGPWLNLMRNSMNTEIWSFKHPDFLCVSATHGAAHLALYDQATWDKYELDKAAGAGITANHFIVEGAAGSKDAKDYEAEDGPFSPADNSIPSLQARGAVFLACHNAIWELAGRLAKKTNPDHLSVDALAAELTNHMVPGVVLTPGAVGTLVELHTAGFAYSH